MQKPEFNLAGTAPVENGLPAIKDRMLKNPRERFFAVVELVNASDHRIHPLEDQSYRTVTVQIVDIEPVVVPDDINTIREVRDRARLNNGGQPTLDGMQTGEAT
jgi:hypothetical protein